MSTETAIATEPTAGETKSPETLALEAANREIDAAEGENTETVEKTEKTDDEPKPPKTPEQREIDRLRKAVDRKTRQREEARAEANQLRERLTSFQMPAQNGDASDSDTVSLTRSQLAEIVKNEAQRLAPALGDQHREYERRQSVIKSLAQTWGQEKFDEVASELDEAFGGLRDSSGRPKAAVEAVFESDAPAKIIEWLADPENLEEAERISKLSAVQAGRAIARLEAKLADKPKPSKLPAPIEPMKGGAPSVKSLGELDDAEFAKRRREFIRNRH